MTADELGLTGLWFEGGKHFPQALETREEQEVPVLLQTKRWLDCYFLGEIPAFTPPLHLLGTDFQLEVWACLRAIPYGETRTYGEIARLLAEKRGIPRMSAQAVGGAVGRNPISIIVPCHRVIGANGGLTGYAGGLERKTALLKLESRA